MTGPALRIETYGAAIASAQRRLSSAEPKAASPGSSAPMSFVPMAIAPDLRRLLEDKDG